MCTLDHMAWDDALHNAYIPIYCLVENDSFNDFKTIHFYKIYKNVTFNVPLPFTWYWKIHLHVSSDMQACSERERERERERGGIYHILLADIYM